MKSSFKITIPEPCHENWEQMTPTQKGRHCASCKKEVIDFTTKTDIELAQLVQSNSNICGRMRIDQVDREITLARNNKSLPSYAAALLIPLAIGITQEVNAQTTENPIEQTINTQTKPVVRPHILGRIQPQRGLLIKGVIADQQENILPGATVQVKGTSRRTQTDFDGNYEIIVSPGEVLVFSYAGYKPLEIKITSQKSIRVHLEHDEIMGEVVIEVMGGLKAIPTKH